MVAPANNVPEVLHKYTVFATHDGITIFRFEEDCNWAVFEIVYPDVARWSVYQREKEWAKNPLIYELNGDEASLDEKRAELAQRRLKSPEEMNRLVAERLQQAKESVKKWQNTETVKQIAS